MEGGRSQLQEDRRRRIILAPYVFCIRFKGSFCTCPQWLDLPKTSSQLIGIQEDLSTRKILSPRKLPSLGRSWYQGRTRVTSQKWWRVVQWLVTSIKADHFLWHYQLFGRMYPEFQTINYFLSYGGSKTDSKCSSEIQAGDNSAEKWSL